MPKTKRAVPTPVAHPPAPEEGTRSAIEAVRRWHRVGKEAVEAAPKGAKNDGPTIKRLADREKVTTSVIRKARLFARHYDTQEKLDALLALRNPGGMPLSWSHIQQLFLVEDEAERTSLQILAAGAGWPVSKLRGAARAKIGDVPSSEGKKRRGGGRRYRRTESPREALRRLVELSRSWLKYYEFIGADGGQSILIKIAEGTPAESDAGWLKQLRSAEEVLRKVERGARKAASRLKAAQSKAAQQQPAETKAAVASSSPTEKGKKGRPAR